MASSSVKVADTDVKGEALYKAADDGNINEVTRLLGKKADINYVYRFMVEGKEWARTPLMAAVRKGHAEVAKFQITRKANVNLADPCHGFTALHNASEDGNIPMIELLISKGAKHDLRDKDGWTPLHFAAVNNHKDAVAFLLDQGSAVNAVDDHGQTALMLEIFESDQADVKILPVVDLLLLRGADPNLVDMSNERSALHYAASDGNLDIVSSLLEGGAHVYVADKEGDTPLILASFHGHLAIVKHLVERAADWKLFNHLGDSCLHKAAAEGHLDIIQYLVSEGAECDWSNNNWTALHEAAQGGHVDIVKYLVEEKGAYMNGVNENRGTTLYTAAFNGHFDTVKVLVLKGADMKLGCGGWTPLVAAVYEGHTSIANLLAKAGARFEEFGSAIRKCKACGKVDNKMYLCRGCDSAFYCCEKCATDDWDQGEAGGHQDHCREIKKRREIYIARVMKEAEEKAQKCKEYITKQNENMNEKVLASSARRLKLHEAIEQLEKEQEHALKQEVRDRMELELEALRDQADQELKSMMKLSTDTFRMPSYEDLNGCDPIKGNDTV